MKNFAFVLFLLAITTTLLTTSTNCKKVTTSLPILHGSSLMNRGLNFHQGGLIPEERLRHTIFKFNYNEGREYKVPGKEHLHFKVPDETFVTTASTHLEKYDSKVRMTYSETLRSTVFGFSFGIGINLGKFGFGAEFGFEYGRIRHNLRSKYTATANGLYFTSTYTVLGIPYLFMTLDDMFQSIINRMPATPRTPQELELYRILIDYFGGFFMWRGVFGGQIKSYTFFTQEIIERSTQTWISMNMKLTFHYKMFEISAGGFFNRSQIRIDKEFLQNSNSEIYFTGGYRHLQTNKTLKEWDDSIDANPGFLTGEFRPLSDLIGDQPIKKKNLEWIIKHYSEHGTIAAPPAAAMVEGTPKIPGYNVIGSGFDPSHLQVRMSVFDHEEGGSFANARTWVNPFYKDLRFKVPSSIFLRENTATLETNFTDLAVTKSAFETTHSRRWTRRGFFVRRTTQVYNYHKRFDLLSQYKITTQRQINWYDLSLNPSLYFNREVRDKHLNPFFKYMVKMLPTDPNDKEGMKIYEAIIQYFGTHFVLGAKMGGRVEQECFFDKELLEYHSINEIRTSSSFSFFGFINIRRYRHRRDERIGKWFKDKSHIVTRFIGGRYVPEVGQSNSNETPWNEFVRTIRTDPGVLEYDVVPIATLIDDPIKKKFFEQAVNKYVEEMKKIPVPKKAPKKEDAPTPEQQEKYWNHFVNELVKNGGKK